MVEKKRKKRNWAPYLLILPSFLYLLFFFGYPMISALGLAFRGGGDRILTAYQEPNENSAEVGKFDMQTQVEVVDRLNRSEEEGRRFTSPSDQWVRIRGETLDGDTVEGWTYYLNLNTDKRISEEASWCLAGIADIESGIQEQDVLTLFTESDRESEIAGTVPINETVDVAAVPGFEDERRQKLNEERRLDTTSFVPGAIGGTDASDEEEEICPTPVTTTEGGQDATAWMKVKWEAPDGETIEGWTNPAYLSNYRRVRTEPVGFTEVEQARIINGERESDWTLQHIERMVNHRNFERALRDTFLLIVLILPLQFILAIIMALVLQAKLKGGTVFLYIYAIPLGISDLAAGLVWLSIFQQNGYINSFLQDLGLIDSSIDFTQYRYWILAIVLAEVWRATSIVMVIVVSGLQAISDEVLEAAEIFGANLWQRLRYVILPLLKPSLQVALILRTILAFQVFAVVIALTGEQGIRVLAGETYLWYARQGGDTGRAMAAAYALLIMIISLSISIFYLRAVRTQSRELAK
jgi:multiple sugar transport system permease protein